jgi:hypothetical protein
MLKAMKFSTLSLHVLSPLAAAVALGFSPMLLAQNSSSSPGNERAIVLGILAAEFSLQNGDLVSAAATSK